MVLTTKGHGRLERREIRTSGDLAGYSPFPGLAQVAEIKKKVIFTKSGEVKETKRYLITSLGPDQADPHRLLSLYRAHWGIENRLFHVKDDRDLLIEKMMTSDGVVFASPNYSFQVSAIMKTYLDRLGFLFHRPRFHGKTFTPIVVQGIYGGGKVVKYLEFVGGGLGFNVVKGSCITVLEPMVEKERVKMEKAIARQSRRFHDQLLKPANPAPSIFQLMGFRMARTSIKLTLGDDNRDHTHYRDQGWFDSDYYYPTRLDPLKKAIGATFDWTAARMSKQREGVGCS